MEPGRHSRQAVQYGQARISDTAATTSRPCGRDAIRCVLGSRLGLPHATSHPCDGSTPAAPEGSARWRRCTSTHHRPSVDPTRLATHDSTAPVTTLRKRRLEHRQRRSRCFALRLDNQTATPIRASPKGRVNSSPLTTLDGCARDTGDSVKALDARRSPTSERPTGGTSPGWESTTRGLSTPRRIETNRGPLQVCASAPKSRRATRAARQQT